MKLRPLSRESVVFGFTFFKSDNTHAYISVHRAHSRVLARLFESIVLTLAFWRNFDVPGRPRDAPGVIRMTPNLERART